MLPESTGLLALFLTTFFADFFGSALAMNCFLNFTKLQIITNTTNLVSYSFVEFVVIS